MEQKTQPPNDSINSRDHDHNHNVHHIIIPPAKFHIQSPPSQQPTAHTGHISSLPSHSLLILIFSWFPNAACGLARVCRSWATATRSPSNFKSLYLVQQYHKQYRERPEVEPGLLRLIERAAPYMVKISANFLFVKHIPDEEPTFAYPTFEDLFTMLTRLNPPYLRSIIRRAYIGSHSPYIRPVNHSSINDCVAQLSKLSLRHVQLDDIDQSDVLAADRLSVTEQASSDMVIRVAFDGRRFIHCGVANCYRLSEIYMCDKCDMPKTCDIVCDMTHWESQSITQRMLTRKYKQLYACSRCQRIECGDCFPHRGLRQCCIFGCEHGLLCSMCVATIVPPVYIRDVCMKCRIRGEALNYASVCTNCESGQYREESICAPCWSNVKSCKSEEELKEKVLFRD